MSKAAYAASAPQRPAFTGIPGDILIARRSRSVCVVCGLTPLVATNPSADAPWVCKTCEGRRPAKPRFDSKKKHERGIENLDRLLKGE